MADQPQPETPEAAQASIAALKNDAAWTAAYVGGDAAKKAEWTRLHEVAYGTEVIESDGMAAEAKAPAARPSAAAPDVSTLLAPAEHGIDGFAEGPLAEAPRGVWEYDFALYGPDATDEQLALELGMKTALYEAEVPTFLASFGRVIVERNISEGLQAWTSPERIASTREELEQRHGEAGAKQIIAEAKKVFDRLDAKSADLGDLLCNSGAVNCPDFLETLARGEREYYAKRGAS